MMLRMMLASASLLSLGIAGSALAQNAPATTPQNASAPQDEATNNDIVVTATKIATNVQDVPIAITAVTGEALEARQITTFADLGSIVPNATFRKSEGIYGAGVSVAVRGQTQVDTQFSGEPPVSYYIDDVYYPFVFGSNFDLLDLDHVEVLRGPQGTLFGRNAIAGAVNLVSKKPNLTEASGYGDITIGSYRRRDFRAGFSIPIARGLAVSASAVSKKRNGYMDLLDFSCQMHMNGTPQLAGKYPFQTADTSFVSRKPKSCVIGHYGGEDGRALRGALRWQPLDNVELNLSADYANSNDESAAEAVFETDYRMTYGLQPDGTVNEAASTTNQNFITMADQFSIPGTPFRWDKRFETGSIYKSYDNFCDPFPAGTKITGNGYYNGSLFRGGNCNGARTTPLTNWGVQGKLSVGITSQIEATAIAGYREIDTVFGAAWDGTIFNDSYIFHEDHMWYWSGEFRLSGRHGWLDWVGGVFYYDAYADENGRPQNTRLGTQQYQNVYYSPNAKAAYLNATVRPFTGGMFKGFSFSGGIRRSDDKKFVDYAANQDASVPGSTTFTPAGTSTYFTLPIANKRWDWKLGVDWEFMERGMVYASASTGYRLPGFVTRLFQKGQQEQQAPTALKNYEVGFKVDLFDRVLRINAAAFLQNYSSRPAAYGGQEARLAPNGVDILTGTQTLIPAGPTGTAFETAFTNCRAYSAATDGAANGKTTGIQCISRTFNYAVSGGSQVKGAEAEITLTPLKRLVANLSVGYTDRGSDTGRPVGFPDWTASGGVQYTADVAPLDGTITPRLDWFYNSRIAYDTNLTQYDDAPRSTFNARISYTNRQHKFDIALGVTNLFDKEYYRQKTIFTAIGAPANIGQPAPPREWYLSISKRF